MKVAINEIVIHERVRREIGDISSLMKSMQDHGQLNPITITRANELIAGHRRLLAATELKWTYIEAHIVDKTSETEKLELELEENIHRKDFSPEELLAGYRRLEKLRRPSLAKRIGAFFSRLFGRLFRRKKKAEQANPPPETTPETQSDQSDVKPESTNETGQFGV